MGTHYTVHLTIHEVTTVDQPVDRAAHDRRYPGKPIPEGATYEREKPVEVVNLTTRRESLADAAALIETVLRASIPEEAEKARDYSDPPF